MKWSLAALLAAVFLLASVGASVGSLVDLLPLKSGAPPVFVAKNEGTILVSKIPQQPSISLFQVHILTDYGL